MNTLNVRTGSSGAQLSGAGYPHFLPQSQDAEMPESQRDICEGQGQVSGQNNYSSGIILEEPTEPTCSCFLCIYITFFKFATFDCPLLQPQGLKRPDV